MELSTEEMLVFRSSIRSLCTKEKKYHMKYGMNYCVHIFFFTVVLLVRCSGSCELLLLHGAIKYMKASLVLNGVPFSLTLTAAVRSSLERQSV